ncbi:MAG: AMP-binding protein [Synergistaceae bacterium]|jgi:long-chain acyl-CoA synthetase|nr:AMP-binding protein [Synergistaceae bacterium]
MNHRLEELVTQNFAKAPTEACLWWRGAWWSRGALEEMAVECEENLAKSGFASGQRLALVMQNSPLLLASCIAAWKLGGAVVPVNPQLKHPPLAEYLKSVDVYSAIVSREAEGLVDLLRSEGIPAAVADSNDAPPVVEGRGATPDTDSDTAVLFHTAGAGGDVKAVPITHGNIIAVLSSIIEIIPSMNEDDVILNAIPNYHSFGFVVGGILPLASGMPQVVVPSFVPPRNALAAIRAAGVTIIPAVPAMLGILLGGDREIAPMSKVKLVFYGGGELMPGVAERTKEIFCVKPLEGYGLTEASSVLAVTPEEKGIKPGASGKILSCFEAEVRGDGGELLPFDSDGRLWIRGEAIAKGYFRAPDISAERFRDGWFDTQDVVRIDEDGYITIVSPAGDVIMVGGVPVYPGEIETVLKRHPDIAEVAVIGSPRGGKGEVVRAFVVLKEGSASRSKDIVMYGRLKLPNYKAPRSVKILPELPKDSLGKVLKKELRGV